MKYAADILSDIGLTACKPVTFPLLTNLKSYTDSGVILPNPEAYKKLIGKLLYLKITRTDLSYSIQHLSSF